MRELTTTEIENVSGGFGFIGAGIGGAIGLASALSQNASPYGAFAAAALGAASGAAGNYAGSAAAGGVVLRTAWGVRSVGLGYTSGVAAGKDEDDS